MDSLDDRESDIPTRTLIESMIREDATIDAGELYDVANGLSMTDQQVRLCSKRLTVEGRFTTAAELGVADHVTTLTTSDLTIGTITEPRELAEHLWPIERITEEHRRLLAVAERYLPALRRASHTEQLTIAIGLAADFDRAMEHDPLLPSQLLPQPWVGTAARAAVAACWAELLKLAPTQPIRLFRWHSEVIAEITNPVTVPL